EKTKASFINHPETGERLYRTGDFGRYLPNHEIEFLGREDAQVKIHGHRIELGEIEASISQHPEVRATALVVVGSGRGDKRLVAYVIPRTEQTLSASALRGFLRQRLPDYMVPAAFVFARSLPLTFNGKIDRKKLAESGEKYAAGGKMKE